MSAWREIPGGIRLRVRLTPRGGRDRIEGLADDGAGGTVLKARVAAPPVDGQANAALIRLVARALGVPRSSVAIAGGGTARVKTLEIMGDAAALAGRLSAL